MESSPRRDLEERVLTEEQLRVHSSLKAMLMFREGLNWRVPDEDNHARVISYVLDNPETEGIVLSLLSRDITDFDEVITCVKENHSALKDGII